MKKLLVVFLLVCLLMGSGSLSSVSTAEISFKSSSVQVTESLETLSLELDGTVSPRYAGSGDSLSVNVTAESGETGVTATRSYSYQLGSDGRVEIDRTILLDEFESSDFPDEQSTDLYVDFRFDHPSMEEKVRSRTVSINRGVDGTSCRTILESDGSKSSGVYEISPDGSSSFEVYCDMDTDGGGWSLVGKVNGRPAMNDQWLTSTENVGYLTNLTQVQSGEYASIDSRYLAGERSSEILISNRDVSKWVKSPIHPNSSASNIFDHSAGPTTVDNAPDKLVTVEDWQGSTESCYINKYMIMPLSGHGGSYPAWTFNTDGNTAGGDLCLGVGVDGDSPVNGWSTNGNGYDAPKSDSDWPNQNYDQAMDVYVWVR